LSTPVWIGLGLSLAAGVMAGNCMLPSKFVRKWQWENTWLVFTIVSLVIVPGILTLLAVHDPRRVYLSIPAHDYVLPFVFGFGWGIAQVLFGLSIARLGLALGYAVIVGLGALLGTMVPILFQRIEVLGTGRGALILAGVFVMVAGIAVLGRAGRMRELDATRDVRSDPQAGYMAALLVAVLCGVMAPMLNYALAFGQEIGAEAVRLGTPAANSAYAIWPVALLGGLIPNLAYSIYLLSKNRTWNRFAAFLPDFWFAALMGVLWMGAMAVYGTSSSFLGALGTSVGWGLFQIFMIMTANVSGVITGEWKSAAVRARGQLRFGLGLLAVATVLMALGNR
jgi:L-rhamnose-H+ transport protein